MISDAERAAQEAAEAKRRDEQRQRELRGAVESQQRTVDSAVTETQQRVSGESAVLILGTLCPCVSGPCVSGLM